LLFPWFKAPRACSHTTQKEKNQPPKATAPKHPCRRSFHPLKFEQHLIVSLKFSIAKEQQTVILTDIAQVIYAPKKAFRSIIANPKYLGAIIVLVLFIGVQIGYEYGQFSKIQLEITAPVPGAMQSFNNATNWQASPDVALTNNFDDYYNNTVFVGELQYPPNNPAGYYPLFGNFSLQIQANNTDTFTAALTNTSNVDCSQTGFQNLSLTIKLIQPQTTPQNATLTLYSLGDTNYYTYDLTSALSTASAVNQWGNLTIPVGPSAQGWTESGNPQWMNITSLTLQFTYPSNSDIDVRIGALFFRGQWSQPIQYDATGFLLRFLQVFSLQFLFTWLILSALVYLILRGLKSPVTWKPLFIALGMALFVMVIRGIVNIIATATLPVSYYPYDVSLGVVYDSFASLYYPATIGTLTAQSVTALATIDASFAAFRVILSAMFVISYVWLGGLTALAIKELKPEFSTMKCIVTAAVSVGVTILALWLFIGIV
jgi:hypothetical protein